MGDPYTDVTVSSYNANPPADDASQVPTNRVDWAIIKSKLSDPLNTAIASLNTNIGAAVDKLVGGAGVSAQAPPYTIQASDQGKLVRATSAGTFTLPAAATVGSPFVVCVANGSAGVLVIDGNAAETVDGETTINLPAGSGVVLYTDGVNFFTAGRGEAQNAESFITAFPVGYIGGLALTQGSADQDAIDHDVIISAGDARDTGDSFNLSVTGTLTKKISSTWTSGNDVGGMADNGGAVSLSPSTFYHVFLVDDGAGNTDAGFDTSITATNLLVDSGGSKYRRIGSVKTDASSNLVGFVQAGDTFWFKTIGALDYDANADGTKTDVAINVPTGVRVIAYVNFFSERSASGFASAIFPQEATSQTPSTSATPLGTVGVTGTSGAGNVGQAQMMTNTSAQISVFSQVNNMATRVATLGWRDFLGRH